VRAGGDRDLHPELLCFRPELTEIPLFESALRERVSQLSTFQHVSYARVRRVDRLNGGTLALFSECTSGVRLAELLAETARRGLVLDINTALGILRQLAPAVALLHQNAQVANGALGPERLILTPQARLVIAEWVVGGALEQLHYSRERYWEDLRVALPPSSGLPRVNESADVTQLGMVGLSLILGRPLKSDEYPSALDDLLASAHALSENGDQEPLSPDLHSWLRRALQLDVRHSFKSPAEAHTGLEELLANDDTYAADTNALTAFLERYHGSSQASTTQEPIVRPIQPTPQASAPSVVHEVPSEPPLVELLPALFQEPKPPVEIQPPVTAPEIADSKAESETAPREVAVDREVSFGPRRTITATEEPEPVTQSKRFSVNRSWIAAAVALFAVAAALFAGSRYLTSSATAASTGTLVVDTNPPGAQVTVDNVPRGRAPLSLSLSSGAHSIVVRGEGEPRTIPVTIVAGATSSHYLDLPKTSVTTGTLQVRTEPSGARVAVDGQPKGTTPLTLTDLASGEHSVTLENEFGSAKHTVVVQPGIPATLVVPLGAPQGAIVSGWMSVSAPIELQIYEQGRLLGSSSIDRIMLAAGTHEIEIANEPLGFRTTRTIQVLPGRVSPVAVVLPKGVVSLNAVPWATVSIDGQVVGETPIGNLSVALGPHEVVFTNPEFGEQRRTIDVTLKTPVRTSIDFSKK
jgi:serine/threonine protein kinase